VPAAPGLELGAYASLTGEPLLGVDVSIGAGARIDGVVTIGDRARFGPNVVVTGTSAEPVQIGRDTELGAGVIVVPGVTVGPYALVQPGTVLTQDVPARAVVGGSPTRIVGYVGTGAAAPAPSPDRAVESLGNVRGAQLLELPAIADVRGALTFAQVGDHLPFVPRRMFVQYAVPSREARGEHAHREQHQLLVCVHGSVRALVDDGEHRAEALLDRPSLALHVPPMVWGGQYDYAPDSVLVVLASDVYSDGDYIRDYDEFETLIRA